MEKCKKCGSEFDVSRMSETTSGEWLCEECAKAIAKKLGKTLDEIVRKD